jgi:hypothetical protein
MRVPVEVIAKLARSVQPLVFETGIAGMPYSVLGTAFLVGYEGRPYVLTTRHSLNPENPGPVCIFPSDTSHHLVPLKDVFFVPRDEVSEDFVDLAVIAIDTSRITQAEVAQATLIDLARASGDWEALEAEFVIFGFPVDHSFVDYDEQMLHTNRVTLHARYVGRSSIPYLHEIEISEAHALTTFSGFSGGPVFAWPQQPGAASAPILCGMAVRGSSSSGRVHFLDRSVLLDALKVKRTHEK